MSLQFRKVTETNRLSGTFIPLPGEPIFELFSNKLFIGDGTTVGGVSVHNGQKLSEILGIPVNYSTVKDRSHIYWSSSANSWRIGLPVKNLATIVFDVPVNGDHIRITNAKTSLADFDSFAGFEAKLSEGAVPILSVPTVPTQSCWLIWSNDKFVSSAIPSAPSLNGLLDAQISSVTRGDVLVYDSSLSQWVNKKISTDVGASSFVSVSSSVSNKQFLVYDGTVGKWINKTVSLFVVPEITDTTTIPSDNALFYNSTTSQFELKTIDYELNDLPEVNITPDQSGIIDNGQILAYDLATQKWITPPDKVAGLTTGLGYSRRVREEKPVKMGSECQCLGQFDVPIEGEGSLNSLTVKGGSNRTYDVALFESEEDRQAFLDSIDCTICNAGQSGNFESFSASNNGDYLQTDSNETSRSGDATDSGRLEEMNQELGGDQVDNEAGEGGGGGADSDMPPGAGGNGRADGSGGGGGGGGGGSGGRGGFNKKKKGVILSRNKTTGVGDGAELELDIEFNTSTYSEPNTPLVIGWDRTNDTYGYYYNFLTTRKADISFDPSYQSLYVHSKMRRCGCIMSRTTGFQVLYYNDADDSTKVAGDWIRIIERQVPSSNYSGAITEQPSSVLRNQVPQWRPGGYYYKGNRVIYNNQLWECLVRQTQQSPAPGTANRPTVYNGSPICEFVEIPAFRVKSEFVGDIYQIQILYGATETAHPWNFDFKVHPAFYFDESGDTCDHLYVAVNLSTGSTVAEASAIYLDNVGPGGKNVLLDARASHRSALEELQLDPGFFLYDYNVHSALQLLMATEFQNLNIEKFLGESNQSPTINQTLAELSFANDIGNGSGMTVTGNTYGAPVGVTCYRGIFRPYGNQGYFVDGINVRDTTRGVTVGQDPLYYSELYNTPITYKFIGTLPSVTLTSGTGYGFINNILDPTIPYAFDRSYLLPTSTSVSATRENYFGDIIAYRGVSTNKNVPLTVATGSPYFAPFNTVSGGYGPFSLSINPSSGEENKFARRLCIKRKGATKNTSDIVGSTPPGTNGVRTVGERRVNKIEASVYIGIIERQYLSGDATISQVQNAINSSYQALIAQRPEATLCVILHDALDKFQYENQSYSSYNNYNWEKTLASTNKLNASLPDRYAEGLLFYQSGAGIYGGRFTDLSSTHPLKYAEATPFRSATSVVNGEWVSLVYNVSLPTNDVYQFDYGFCMPRWYITGSPTPDPTNKMSIEVYIDDILTLATSATKSELPSHGVKAVAQNVSLNAGTYKIEVRYKLDFNAANQPTGDLNTTSGYIGLAIKDITTNTVRYTTAWGTIDAVDGTYFTIGGSYYLPDKYGVAQSYQGFKTPHPIFGNKERVLTGSPPTEQYIGFFTDWFDTLKLGSLPRGTVISVGRYGKTTTFLNNWNAWNTFLTKCSNAGFIVKTQLISTTSSNPNYHNWVNAASGY